MSKLTEANYLAQQVEAESIDYEVIYRIPASDDWPWGDEVGFVEVEDWMVAVNWDSEGDIIAGHYAVEPGDMGVFPGATRWMITDNDAIDHGLEAPTA